MKSGAARRSIIRRILAVLLLAAFSGLSLAAQPDPSNENVFLWEVSSEKGKVYLLGSIHLARPDLYPLNQAISDAYAQAGTLVVEVNLDEQTQAKLRGRIMSAGAFSGGRTLDTHLSAEILEQLKAYLAERRLPFAMFNPMKPWLASILITAMELRRHGYEPRHGIDRHFLRRAKEEGKPVRELESADFQIRLLSGISDELQQYLLLSSLQESSRVSDMIGELTSAWKRGDAARVEKLLLKSRNKDSRLQPVYETIIYDRNLTMTAHIREYLAAGGTWFVVVGSGHLVGERGILDLLRKDSAGEFSIRQVGAN